MIEEPNEPMEVNWNGDPQFTLQVENESKSLEFTLMVGSNHSSLFSNQSNVIKYNTSHQLIVAEAVGLFKAVTADGLLVQDNEDSKSKYVGISVTSGSSGSMITVVKEGPLENPNWAFNVNEPVYLTSNGNLTQSLTTFPARRIGYALTPTRLNLDAFGFVELASAQW